MYPTRREYVGIIPNIIAGQRAKKDIVNGVRTFFLDFLITATVEISVAPVTNLRNLGSIAGAFTEIGLLENAQERWNISGMEALHISELIAPQPTVGVRAGTAIGVYNLRELIRLPMVMPWAASPEETPFLEADPTQALEAFVTLDTQVLSGALFTIGGATVAFTNIQVECRQVYDTNRDRRALFIPTARIIPLQITAAAPGADTDLMVRTAKYVRLMSLGQNSSVGIVNDIANRALFRGDRRVIIGPQPIPYQMGTREAQYNFGGKVTGTGFGTAPVADSWWPLNFQEGGRLSNILNPAFDTNWRWQVNAQVTAAAGSTRSELRLIMLELEEVDGLTIPHSFPI